MSERETREVSKNEQEYQDGTEPQVLDFISITLKQPQPHNHQRENHVLDDAYWWQKQGQASWGELIPAVEHPKGPLWNNGYSTQHGLNDKVSEIETIPQKRSLYLIHPEHLVLQVGIEDSGQYGSKRTVRAQFALNGITYRLSVTDPPVKQVYLGGADGEYPITTALVCVSLGEIYHGSAFKLAAAVITPERAKGTP